MASTYSNLGMELQATGENANTWGTKTNTNWSIVDERLSEIYTITSTSSSQTIAAPTDATASQSTRYATLKYSGSASSAITVTLPSSVKIVYNVVNSMGQDITFQCSTTTTTATIKNGKSGIIHSDGSANVYLLSNTGSATFSEDITAKTSDGAILNLQTSDTDIAVNDVLGQIDFQAPSEGTGTDAILVAGSIACISEGDFSSSNNASTLSFKTAASEAASEKMKITSAGVLSIPADGSTTANGIHLGAGADLKIYHTGSHSVINDTGTGNLQLAGSQVDIMGGTDLGETMATFADDGAVTLYYDNSAKIATASGGITVTGALTATGDITAYYSDERLKDVHGSIENALDKVCQLDGFIYSPNDTAEGLGYKKTDRKAGISAQACEKVLPEAVTEAPISSFFKAVQYDQLIPLLINSIKELKSELDEHKKGCQCNGSTD